MHGTAEFNTNQVNTNQEGGTEMISNNSPNITPVSFRTTADEATPQAPSHDERLSGLRSELDSLVETIAGLSSQGAAAVGAAAKDGVTTLRSTIEERPWMAIGVAVVAGAVLASAIVPRSRRGFQFSDRSTYTTDDITATLRRAAENRINPQPLISRFERLMDSISSIDPSAVTSSPAYDTAKTWLQSLAGSVRKS